MCTNSNSTWDWGPRGVTSLAWEVKEGLKAEKMRSERRGNQAEGTGGCTWQVRADTGVGGGCLGPNRVQGGCQQGPSTEIPAQGLNHIHVCNPSLFCPSWYHDHYPLDNRETLTSTGWG